MSGIDQQWNDIWTARTVQDEIAMADFYSGRQFILKYVPRHGVTIEAGCGLGRYVFYLSELGVHVIGTEFSRTALDKCRKWALDNGYDADRFGLSDVRALPYPDDFFSGYISLGVIEHFQEGPAKALEEAYRVLAPGGIAIISTPNKYSPEILFYAARRKIRTLIKSLLTSLGLYRPKAARDVFFQYEFSVNELAGHVKRSGFDVVEKACIGMKFPIYELFRSWHRNGVFQRLKKIILTIADLIERSPLGFMGGLVMIIACKPARTAACFFCGHPGSGNGHLRVPVCENCLTAVPPEILRAYRSDTPTIFKRGSGPVRKGGLTCSFCRQELRTNSSFAPGNYGFSVPVCPHCLRDPSINLRLANYEMMETWREW
jgi:SAM-dependent methyltransferase